MEFMNRQSALANNHYDAFAFARAPHYGQTMDEVKLGFESAALYCTELGPHRHGALLRLRGGRMLHDASPFSNAKAVVKAFACTYGGVPVIADSDMVSIVPAPHWNELPGAEMDIVSKSVIWIS